MSDAVPAPTGKRTDYISWDEYFMATAALFALHNQQRVGGCVVNEENKIVGTVYDEGILAAGVSSSGSKASCTEVLKAVLQHTTADLRACRIYVVRFPCYNCAELIADSAIRELVYLSDSVDDTEAKSHALLVARNVSVRRFVPDSQRASILIDFCKPCTSMKETAPVDNRTLKPCEPVTSDPATAPVDSKNQNSNGESNWEDHLSSFVFTSCVTSD